MYHKNINEAANAGYVNKKLKKMQQETSRKINFDKNIYELGTNWGLLNLTLEEAGELGKNKNFIDGYARGQRLRKISDEKATEHQKTR